VPHKQSDRRTDDTRTQIPVLVDDGDELLVTLLSSAVGIDVDREGLGNTDGVGELDENTTSKASSDKGLGCRKVSALASGCQGKNIPIQRAV